MSHNVSDNTFAEKEDDINNEVVVAPVRHNEEDEASTEGEIPTEAELHTLRRVADKIPLRVYTIAFVELCERFSYYGTTVVCMFMVFSCH